MRHIFKENNSMLSKASNLRKHQRQHSASLRETLTHLSISFIQQVFTERLLRAQHRCRCQKPSRDPQNPDPRSGACRQPGSGWRDNKPENTSVYVRGTESRRRNPADSMPDSKQGRGSGGGAAPGGRGKQGRVRRALPAGPAGGLRGLQGG